MTNIGKMEIVDALREQNYGVYNFFLYSLVVVFSIIPAWSLVLGEEMGEIVISVRDVETGYALPAFISVSKVETDGSTGPVIDSFQASSGEILKSYPAGKYIVEVKMEGYKPMKSWFVIEAGKRFHDRYMLSPVEPREKKKQESDVELLEDENVALVRGYITDDKTGKPLKGVRITFKKSGIKTYSDKRGYYEAYIPIEERICVGNEEIEALEETIIYSLKGYKTRKELNKLLTARQVLENNMVMFKGRGVIVENKRHKLLYSVKNTCEEYEEIER